MLKGYQGCNEPFAWSNVTLGRCRGLRDLSEDTQVMTVTGGEGGREQCGRCIVGPKTTLPMVRGMLGGCDGLRR